MEAKRIVKMRNGKFAIQNGTEVEDNFPFDRDVVHLDNPNTHVEWDFEIQFSEADREWHKILFDKESEAEAHVQNWLNENTISEICTEFYINEEK